MLSIKNQIIILIVCTTAGVAVGRFTVPVKTVTQIKTVEVEKQSDKKDTKTDTNSHKVVTIVEAKRPDGTDTKTTTIVVDTGVDSQTHDSKQDTTAVDKASIKETIKDSGHLSISALAGVNPFNMTQYPGLIYGAHVHKDLIGPISIGVWALSNGTCGMSAGLTF